MGLVHKRILAGNADAVEWCSTPGYHNILAAASYTLIEGPTPTRIGGIYLFSLDDHSHLRELQTLETSGVFDIKWRRPPSADAAEQLVPCLGQASADGSLCLYTLQQQHGGDEVTLLQETSKVDVDSSSMCLSLDWSPTEAHIAVSHSNGTLTIVDVGEGEPQVCDSGEAHELETWITSYDSWHPQVLYTGADDSHFCGWDTRQGLTTPTFRNRKTHTMGVCSIQTNPSIEHSLITGSYDEKLRLWDMRKRSSPLVETGLGGGVWRLKWHGGGELVLAACMHRGFVIARIIDGEQRVEVVEEYVEHESLAYGADWCAGEGSRCWVATCSFYDKALHVWEPSSITKTLS